MNIKSKIEKLEKRISINEIPKEVFAKLGMIPICKIDYSLSEQEKEKTITTTKNEYFNKLASELNTSPEKAEELYKKTGLHPSPLVIEFV